MNRIDPAINNLPQIPDKIIVKPDLYIILVKNILSKYLYMLL